ncbi:MAG: molybdopterin-guanine dinucleotide biosynthesis protein MobB [Clostridia bacterium]|nr:molybdopterin-guanine dinucleotide biosynthesis protein MobB [Clostridia bacterium]
MKIITVVGIRGAGKTTVVESLLRALTDRGLRVGTVKTVFCPTFHMDKPGSNTYRHTAAGAALVTAKAETETTVLYPYPLRPSEILAHYRDCDWVLCEGDYDLPVARVVAAHGPEDARERINDRTVAVSGLIANDQTALDGLPVLHPQQDIDQLVALLMEKAPDIQELSALDEALNGPDAALSRDFCARGCRGHGARKPGVLAVVDGIALKLSPEREALLRAWAQEAEK